VIRLQLNKLATIGDAQALLQTAIGVEFGTLPPYLYSLYSIRPGTNAEAARRIRSIVLQEMIHLCLGCNILNALGGTPALNPQSYPGPLPGDIGPDGKPLTIHLLPFSREAMQQGMKIEEPEDPPHFPVRTRAFADVSSKAVTIGQFYAALDQLLATLPASAWTPHKNQIVDDQFFPGQLFAVNGYADAHLAITEIVSEGEGAKNDPLDFQEDLAHYYRFGEIYHEKVLTLAPEQPLRYTWGPERLPVDWCGAYPAISDPGKYDFSKEPPAARAAQDACNAAFEAMVDALQAAVTGEQGALGRAVRYMFDLRMAALHAFTVPLSDGKQVAGPAFIYKAGHSAVSQTAGGHAASTTGAQR
jgi:hypothetical protein